MNPGSFIKKTLSRCGFFEALERRRLIRDIFPAVSALIVINFIAGKHSLHAAETILINGLILTVFAFARKGAAGTPAGRERHGPIRETTGTARAKKHQDTEILYSLNRISLSFYEKRNLNYVLESMLYAVCKIFRADRALLEILPSRDDPGRKLVKGNCVTELDGNIYRKVLGDGNALAVNNLNPHHREYAEFRALHRSGVISFLVVPLKINRSPIGLIGIFTTGQYRFTGSELRRLSAFANHASLILENARLFSRARRLSITDDLTRLYNFRYLTQKADEEIKRAGRYNHRMSLLLCDIDNFKNYNDLNGHEAGNEALRKLSGILRNSVREVDFVARYGGEEFIILLPETEKEKAFITAGRLRKIIEQEHFPNEKEQPRGNFTVTIGVSEFPGDATCVHELISRADSAMYRGKNEGKNRVMIFRASPGN